MSLTIVPMTRDEANAFVAQHHRHHKPVVGHIFAIGCVGTSPGCLGPGRCGCEMAASGGKCTGPDAERIVGVAIVGRPVARGLQDGWTAEVTRVATNGHRNACSFLYGACWRATRALGYRKLVTYTLPEEGGASLRAAGWTLIGEAGGGSWNCKSRPRVDKAPTQVKLRWEATT